MFRGIKTYTGQLQGHDTRDLRQKSETFMIQLCSMEKSCSILNAGLDLVLEKIETSCWRVEYLFDEPKGFPPTKSYDHKIPLLSAIKRNAYGFHCLRLWRLHNSWYDFKKRVRSFCSQDSDCLQDMGSRDQNVILNRVYHLMIQITNSSVSVEQFSEQCTIQWVQCCSHSSLTYSVISPH